MGRLRYKTKSTKTKVRNVIVISDTHVGCQTALVHPDGADLDDGGLYRPSRPQKKLWGHWEQFWGEWVPWVTDGEPFAVIHNGDAIDGSHHNSTEQWTHNLEDQVEHAYKILKPVVEACEGRYYHIRGTEAHVGKCGANEEQLAKRLGAVQNEHGRYARYDLWIRVAGVPCHFLHHIGTTSSAQYETSALTAEYAAMCVDAARFGYEPPQIIGRSHRHRNAETRQPNERGCATVFVTPAWQGKTSYAWRIAGARVTTPQFGGSVIRTNDKWGPHTLHCVWHMPRSEMVEL